MRVARQPGKWGLRGGAPRWRDTGQAVCICLTEHSALCLSLIQEAKALRWLSPFPCKRGPRLAACKHTPVQQDTSPHHTAGVQTRPPVNGDKPHTVRVLTRPMHWAARHA